MHARDDAGDIRVCACFCLQYGIGNAADRDIRFAVQVPGISFSGDPPRNRDDNRLKSKRTRGVSNEYFSTMKAFSITLAFAISISTVWAGPHGHGHGRGHMMSMPSRGGATFSRSRSGTFRNWSGRNWNGRNWSGRNWSGRNWSGDNWGGNQFIFSGGAGFPFFYGYPYYGYFPYGYQYGYYSQPAYGYGYYGNSGYGYYGNQGYSGNNQGYRYRGNQAYRYGNNQGYRYRTHRIQEERSLPQRRGE